MIRIACRDLEEDVITEIQIEQGWERIVTSVILRALVAAEFEVFVEDDDGKMVVYEEYQS
tara:strand:+ start:1013 stop:1192 length:180 start_codon:yes stop_codon:yes gene_type:complete